MINLSNSTPAPPSGSQNIQWQSDASGNVSGYLGLGTTKTTYTPSSGVITLDASQGNSFLISVTAAITSMSITNPTDGQVITILWAQDSTGHAVATASNMLGSFSITTSANKHSCYQFTYNVGDTNWYEVGVNNM